MGICITSPLGRVNPFTVMVSEHLRLVLYYVSACSSIKNSVCEVHIQILENTCTL